MAISTQFLACVVLGVLVCAPGQAIADHQPVLVIPGRRDVPVTIDGYDATWAVVYGDVGLYRPGHQSPQIQGRVLIAKPFAPAGYYPATGLRPRMGRREVDPVRGRRQATGGDFYRSWSARSEPNTVTEYPPFDPPQVIMAPPGGPRKPPARR